MTQEEYNALMKLEKRFKDPLVHPPVSGENKIFDVESITSTDMFYADIDRRGSFSISRAKFQNRMADRKIPLVRVDIDSPPHLNPDGTKTTRNHIHIYHESDGDSGKLSWAYSLESFEGFSFNSSSSFMDIFREFCRFCNIDFQNVQEVF